MASVGSSTYRNAIRSAVRGLWAGALDYYQAWEIMDLAIRGGIPAAFHEGMAEFGILPSEISPAERIEIERIVMQELGYVDRLLTAVEAGNKAAGGKLGPLFNRAEMWANRYRDATNRAKVMAGEDRKLKWVLGPTEHCADCARLADKVKRASQWEAAGIRPQMRELECGGYRCQCNLVPTEDPMSKGPLPKLRGG